MKKRMHKLRIPYEILRLLTEYEPSYLWWSLPQIVTSSLLPLLAVYMPKRILETLTDGSPYLSTARVIAIYCGILLLLRILNDFFSYNSELAAEQFAEHLRFEIGKITMRLEMKDIETATQREIIQMANNAAGLTEILGIIKQMLSNIISIAGLAWITVQLNAVFLLAIFVVLSVKTLFTCLQFKYRKKSRELSARNDRIGSYLNGLAYFNHGAEKELRLNNLQKWFMGKIVKYRGEMLRIQYREFRQYAIFESIMAVLMAVQSLVVLLLLGENYIDRTITIADFTMYFSAVTTLTTSLHAFTQQIRRYNEQVLNFIDYRKLLELLSRRENDTPGHSTGIPKQIQIVFDDVSFAYPGSDKNALEHIRLTISDGEKLMLVGLNGSGKTTLIKLLCKLYRPTAGTITLNGQDIWSIPNRVYYQGVSAVFQDYKNFAFSLAENILLNETPERKRIAAILRELGMEEFLKTSPKGLDTCLTRNFDSDGVELSGGQDQKLAIARAIYKNTPLLILDEPTASLDAKAESELYMDFWKMARGKTAIFISHRLAASTLAERIAILENGKIVEYGSHTELLEHGGLYADMYAKQSRPYA